MIHVLVRFTVEDLAKWKSVFEEAATLRKDFGSMGVRAFSKADNPNEVTILGEYADKDKPCRCSSRRNSARRPSAGASKVRPR